MSITTEEKMNRPENALKNENGSVMVIALVMLVLITLMGLSVTRLSDVDVQIAKNEREYVQNFYVADSAWREAVQWLDTRASVPGLVNKKLYVDNDPDDPDDPKYTDNALNVRNYGDGDEGIYNDDFTANPDGTLGALNYWYKVAYINDEAQQGEVGTQPDPNHTYFQFKIVSVVDGAERVEVTVKKLFETGQKGMN